MMEMKKKMMMTTRTTSKMMMMMTMIKTKMMNTRTGVDRTTMVLEKNIIYFQVSIECFDRMRRRNDPARGGRNDVNDIQKNYKLPTKKKEIKKERQPNRTNGRRGKEGERV